MSIETGLHPLERLVKAGLDTPFLVKALEKLVEDQIKHEEAELQRLRPRLDEYEERYQLSSKDFFQRYQNGEMGDDMDFFEWNVFYKMFQDSQQRLHLLKDK